MTVFAGIFWPRKDALGPPAIKEKESYIRWDFKMYLKSRF